MKILSLILRIVAAAVLAQTLFFKFTGHPDSVAIFTAIGMEPEGRILIGVLELIAAVLLLVPGTVAFGAILSMGVMTGAMVGHFTDIGFADGMLSLFVLALVVWVCSAAVLVIHRRQIPIIRQMFAKSKY